MILVIDASVALKWYLKERPDEAHLEQALAVGEEVQMRGGILLAPAHWQAEVAAVLAREAPQYVDEMLQEFEWLAPTIVGTSSVMRRACDLSRSLNHHLFDTLYHAVALEAGATLVTADDRYFDKAAGHGGLMRLADFPVTAA